MQSRGSHGVAVADPLDVPWLPAVEGAEPRSRVVQLVVDGCAVADGLACEWNEAKPRCLRAFHHPIERHERHALLRVAAADVGMHAREPHLLDAVGARSLTSLVPHERMERPALVIDG
jgi:hypothetical protein